MKFLLLECGATGKLPPLRHQQKSVFALRGGVHQPKAVATCKHHMICCAWLYVQLGTPAWRKLWMLPTQQQTATTNRRGFRPPSCTRKLLAVWPEPSSPSLMALICSREPSWQYRAESIHCKFEKHHSIDNISISASTGRSIIIYGIPSHLKFNPIISNLTYLDRQTHQINPPMASPRREGSSAPAVPRPHGRDLCRRRSSPP